MQEHTRSLGGDFVIEAAQEWAKRHLHKIKPCTVKAAVKEFLEEKERQNKSKRHLETLKSHCNRFAGGILMNMTAVTAADINGFLDRLKGTGERAGRRQEASRAANPG